MKLENDLDTFKRIRDTSHLEEQHKHAKYCFVVNLLTLLITCILVAYIFKPLQYRDPIVPVHDSIDTTKVICLESKTDAEVK